MARSEEFTSARARATAALADARRAIEAMLEHVDPVTGDHDDVSDLIMSVTALGDLARELKPEMEAAVLAWLLANEGGVRSVRVGELKYWGEKDKTTKCLDVGDTFGTLAHIRLAGMLTAVAVQEEDAEERFWLGVRDLARSVVSANGLKEGACRAILADAAEADVLADYRLDPTTVAVREGEDVAAAVARAREAAREAAFATFFEETWPDKVKGGEAKTKLGVANLRFVYRRGGGTKADFEEMERKRFAAGETGA